MLSEFAVSQVGRTALHRHYTTDEEYCLGRVEEDMRDYRRRVDSFPGAQRTADTKRVMARLYGSYWRHQWLPLESAFPFNLRGVCFVTLLTRDTDPLEPWLLSWALSQRIRQWGCPVSPVSPHYQVWCQQSQHDSLFNIFTVVVNITVRVNMVQHLRAIGKQINKEDGDDSTH